MSVWLIFTPSVSPSNPRILLLLSEAWGLRDSETFLILFEDANSADIHTKHVTIQPKDLSTEQLNDGTHRRAALPLWLCD